MSNTLTAFTLAQNGVNLASRASNALSGGAKKSTENSFRYPLKALDNTTDWLSIKIFEYVLPAGGSQFSIGSAAQGFKDSKFQAANFSQTLSKSNISPQFYITLPIPQNITDSTSVTWGEDTVNPLAVAGVGVAAGRDRVMFIIIIMNMVRARWLMIAME